MDLSYDFFYRVVLGIWTYWLSDIKSVRWTIEVMIHDYVEEHCFNEKNKLHVS